MRLTRFELIVAVLAVTGACGAAVAEPLAAPIPLEGSALEPALTESALADGAAPIVAGTPLDGEAKPSVRTPRPIAALVETGRATSDGAQAIPLPVHMDFDPLALLPLTLLLEGTFTLPATPAMPTAGGDGTRGTAASTASSHSPSTGTPSSAHYPPSRILQERASITPAAGTMPSRAAPVEEPVRTQSAGAEAPEGPTVQAWVVGGTVAAGIVGLLGVALYSRIRPSAALENETRKLIFDAVCHNPGLGVHTLAKMSGVSYSTATYHLERLVAAGMIVMTPDGNKLCYYKNGGAFTESERRILPLVKNDEASRLFEAILDTPGTYRAALATRLGVTATTINWHLRRLRDAGLVEEARHGRNAYLYVRADTARDGLLNLARKIHDTDPDVAQRLERYAAQGDAPPGAA